jgi:hypothetical protein
MEKNIKLNLKTQTIKPYKIISPPISDSSHFKHFLDVYFKLKITPSSLKRI